MPWSDLIATALIGTQRRAANPAEVLDAAAGWAPYRRAGIQPTTVDDVGPVAPAEDLPPVPEAANLRLATLLQPYAAVPGDAAAHELMVVEWLTLATASGRRVMPSVLPALLDQGRQRTDLRPLIAAVGGARARWLAGQNPDWRYLTQTAEQSTLDIPPAAWWETGNRAQRLAYLRHLRRTDPTAGRELLDRDWPTLTPDERGDLTTSLADGLDLADEPLLERALDDRRSQVRDAAAAILVRLPGSAYQARMLARARACVAVGPGGDLRVTPPVACDPAMRRDGIAAKPPAGTGERAWWLEEVLARAPLPSGSVPAAAFLARPAPDDWGVTVHRGLARAAAAQRDPAWAAAALDTLGDTPRDRTIAATLYPVLDAEQLADRAVAALTHGSTARWGALLVACPPPWPDGLSQAAFDGIAALVARPDLAGELYQLCRLAAVRLPVRFAPAAHELTERAQASFPDQQRFGGLGTMTRVLAFRAEMADELSTQRVLADKEVQ